MNPVGGFGPRLSQQETSDMKKLKTLTVRELIARLQDMPQDDEVRVWLPGTTIALSSPFKYQGTVRIEGNIDPGSALDMPEA